MGPWLLAAACLTPLTSARAAGQATMSQLMNMPLGNLTQMPVTVTSVSKHAEPLQQAPSAVYVLTQQDLRRSGATSIPEALRMVPGVQVARLDANEWAITVRGFDGQYANKLLVLVDGRSVYTPLFSGVYWDALGIPMSEIKRIEVIRGPGATLWGVNAVNGVINIITKSAADTVGTRVSVTGGNANAIATARYGAKLGAGTYVRTWVRSQHVLDSPSDGSATHDAWTMNNAGLRLDSDQGDQHWMFDAGYYRGLEGSTDQVPTLTPPYSELQQQTLVATGDHFLLKWQKQLAPHQHLTVKGYYDQTRRDQPSYMEQNQKIMDLEVNHRWRFAPEQSWQWGLDLRQTREELQNTTTAQFTDPSPTMRLYSAYGQYTHWLDGQRGKLVIGSKFTQTSDSGFSTQPSIRTTWALTSREQVWAAISRAVRTPSVAEQTGRVDAAVLAPNSVPGSPIPAEVVLTGNPDYGSEKMVAYELGLRSKLAEGLSLDNTAFYNRYSNLIALAPQSPLVIYQPRPVHAKEPLLFVNEGGAKSSGFESVLDWLVMPNWRLQLNYSYLRLTTSRSGVSADTVGLNGFEGQSPRHQIKFRSLYNINDHWEFDSAIYYTSKLSAYDIGPYTRLDLRLGWNPDQHLQFSLGGKNLLKARHREYGRTLTSLPTEVGRTFYLSAAYEF